MRRSTSPAADIAVLQAPNMSLGVNVLFKIAGEVAKLLGGRLRQGNRRDASPL